MNKIFKYFMMVVVAIAGLSLASCSDDDDNYNVGEFSDGAYLYVDSTDVVFGPTDQQVFTVKIGRTDATEAQTLSLTCNNDKFTAPTSVSFAAGEKDVVIPVTCTLELGQSEDVSFTIPTDKSAVYGDDSISMTITRDYTWEKVGTVEFSDGLFGLSATVDVMKAKEYESIPEAGDTISYYKFVTPMTVAFKQAGEEELPGGVDFKFYMDNKGTVQPLADGFYDIEKGTSLVGYQFYYDHTKDDCIFKNENGEFTFSAFLSNGTAFTQSTYSWIFDWKDGYPIKNTEEGDNQGGSQEGDGNQEGGEAGK